MTTLDILGFILLIFFGLVAWLLFCIAKWGQPKTSQRQAEELAEQAEALKARTIAQEDEWITDLEALIVEQRANLALLRSAPPTLENLDARGRAVVSIGSAERVVRELRSRKAYTGDRRQTAATVFEGRM